MNERTNEGNNMLRTNEWMKVIIWFYIIFNIPYYYYYILILRSFIWYEGIHFYPLNVSLFELAGWVLGFRGRLVWDSLERLRWWWISIFIFKTHGLGVMARERSVRAYRGGEFARGPRRRAPPVWRLATRFSGVFDRWSFDEGMPIV